VSDAWGTARRGGEPDGLRPFDCLWCGQTWHPHEADDLEALARLCPGCLGRADSNPFIRFRLRAALEARARIMASRPWAPDPDRAGNEGSARDAAGPETDAALAAEPTHATGSDDWYLRRGRHARGQVQDLAWQVDLDAATTWLDGLPIAGRIVELAAGTGWWSALLASKGGLSAFDTAPERLDRARERLLAHRLRAHLHVRDPWTEPDAAADVLFTAFWLSRVPRPRLGAFLVLARRWLLPGGLYVFIDSLPAALLDAEPSGAPHAPAELTAALVDVGFTEVAVATTSRYFVLGRARSGGESTAREGEATVREAE
jgi:SAM-dependent methyltransferase